MTIVAVRVEQVPLGGVGCCGKGLPLSARDVWSGFAVAHGEVPRQRVLVTEFSNVSSSDTQIFWCLVVF